MNNLKIISTQTSWQIFGKIVSSVCTFIILGIVARSFGESGIGVFTLALTYLAIFYLLADFGFNAHLLKEVHGNSKILEEYWRKLFGVRLVWSLVLAVIAVATLPFWPFANQQFSMSVLLGSMSIVASGIFVTSNLVFQTKLRYDLSVIASSIGSIAGLAAVFLFALEKATLPWVVFAQFLSWSIIAIFSLIFLKKFIKYIAPVFDLDFTKNLLKESWPIAATLALNVVYFRIDTFILSSYYSDAVVGIYNIAYQFFQTALVIPTFIMNAYYPFMIETLKISPLKFIQQVKLAALGLITLAIFGTIITLAIAPFLINLLTGGGFAGSAISLRILSLGFPGYFLSALLMWILVVKKHYKIMLSIYAIGLLFNLTTNFIFIPKYSFYAASWITVISEYLILILQLVSLVVLSRTKK